MEKLKPFRCLILAIADLLLVGIVIYGLFDWVYAGYPKFVPYTIIIFFVAMAGIRLYKFSMSANERKDPIGEQNIEELFVEEPVDDSAADLEPNKRGFRQHQSEFEEPSYKEKK